MCHFDTFNTPTERLYNYFSVSIFLPFPEQLCANHPKIFRIGVMQISSLLMEADTPCRWHKWGGVCLVVVQKEKEDHHQQQNEASLKKMEETIHQHKFLLSPLPTHNRRP
jgi:hypothetical protein